jgi:hypothetical protein
MALSKIYGGKRNNQLESPRFQAENCQKQLLIILD